MADEKVRYVLDVDDKGSPKLIKFGDNAKTAGKKAEKSFDGASKSVKEFGEQIPGVSGAMKTLASGPAVVAGAAVAALGAGFASMIKKQIDFADGMNDLSLRLGISTERLSVLSLYAEQSGTDIESLAEAMGTLGVKISEGDKNLARWGITARTSDEALFQLADRIAATEDPMLRLKIVTDAFGRSGQKMLPLLVQGGDALRQMADSAPVVSAEMAAMADRVNDRFAELNGRIQGIALGIADKIMPQIDLWLDGVDRIRRAMGLLSKEEEYQEKRTEARAKIIATYADLIEKRKAGEKLIGPVKGAITVDGMTLQQALAAFDRNNPLERPGSAIPPAPTTGVIGAGSGTGGGRATSVDVSGMYTPEYFAGLPISDKARASLEKQYDAEVEREAQLNAERVEEQRQLWNAAQDRRFKEQAAREDEMAKTQNEQWNRMASSVSGAFSSAFSDIYNNGTNAFVALGESFRDLFVNKAINALADLATNTLLGSLLGGPGTGAASLVGGFFARGGEPPVGGLSVVNERRQEAIVPRGPVRVEPTAASGNTYVFQVQNPAQAATLQRSIEREKRQGKRGIR